MRIASVLHSGNMDIFQPVSAVMMLDPERGRSTLANTGPSGMIGVVPFMEEICWPRQFTEAT
jgi:hypothetical protein